jgi:hypothetical protein
MSESSASSSSTPPPMPAVADGSDPRDYVLELSGMAGGEREEERAGGRARANFLSIHFRCCGVYAPIYRNAAGTAYAGHCPRCRRAARVAIGAGGETGRIFTAQ